MIKGNVPANDVRKCSAADMFVSLIRCASSSIAAVWTDYDCIGDSAVKSLIDCHAPLLGASAVQRNFILARCDSHVHALLYHHPLHPLVQLASGTIPVAVLGVSML